jgi:CheY-like chemotaxis protein
VISAQHGQDDRATSGKLKIIALSASVLSFNRQDAFAAGCDDFLPKPFREDDLLARLGLALQLEWIRSDADAPRGSRSSSESPRSPSGPPPTALSPAVIEELLACAQRGEIAQLRRLLAVHPHDPLATALETLARSYQMEKIRELLECQVTIRPLPTP